MKIILGLSLILNVILGYFLLTRKPEEKIIEKERLIIETHERPREVSAPTPGPVKKTSKDKNEGSGPVFHPLSDAPELQESSDKMEDERLSFITDGLGRSEELLQRHKKIQQEYYESTSNILGGPKDGSFMVEPTLKQRRQLLDLDEKYYQHLEKLYGKKDFERYRKFRENYNLKGYKRQMEDNQPFIFMPL